MDIRVFPTEFKGDVKLIGSKSLSHRYVIAASLAGQQSHLEGLMDSDDLTATREILKAFGMKNHGNNFQGPLSCDAPVTVHAKASGSSLRFLIPLALLFNQPITFMGEDRLPDRSLKAYVECFKDQPITFNKTQAPWLPLTVQGPLKPGTFHLDASLSSQFVSGLLFALPLLAGDSTIHLEGILTSQPYIDMTLAVLKQFHIHIDFNPPVIHIPGFQTYHGLKKTIEGDYSHSIFFLAGALMNGDLNLLNLPKDSLQGDQKGVDWLLKMGANLERCSHSIHAQTSTLSPFDGSLSDHPDLALMLMALAASIPGRSHFYDLERLNHKESKRLDVMKEILERINVPIQGDATHLIIDGIQSFDMQGSYDTYHDHRIAMTLMMMAAKANRPYIIKGVECTEKSYPEFLDVYQSIGGRFERLGENT